MTNTNAEKIEMNHKFIEYTKAKRQETNFNQEIAYALSEYGYDKNHLLLAYKNLYVETQLYIAVVPTYKNDVFDGEVTIVVSGTEEEVKEFLPVFKNKIEAEMCDEEGLSVGEPYYNEVGLPLPLVHKDKIK